jgi:hypothetical protein
VVERRQRVRIKETKGRDKGEKRWEIGEKG